MAGVGGFEPPHADTKNRCLTTWLHPIAAQGLLQGFRAVSRGLDGVSREYPQIARGPYSGRSRNLAVIGLPEAELALRWRANFKTKRLSRPIFLQVSLAL